ncbi:unnamed protein product [Notodromas monacha]|uniref:Major facilitator superfamily (MFS) profile domain-containing protein n=1 Tax=Notodromas monacha TaxID=399045 RepID=A0A7R9BG76_9CRUS|nr:unnamed protein product [Notodromas monacha]CAG0913531.1 unnamed protein product [Notodromas monacha]
MSAVPHESQVGLMKNEDTSDPTPKIALVEEAERPLTRRQLVTVSVLCFVNLINYMDRFTLAGILTDLQCYFSIGNDEGGLLQTVFILSYMIFAPLFGYLGDRHSRKIIMSLGVFLWSLTTLIGSFMTGFGWFIFFRAMVGIGEASYSTIAPTIISDMFVKDMRSRMLALFYFAIPVGSGLGYITGSKMREMFGAWQWSLRVTPAMGMLAIIFIIFFMDDPPRGESEGAHLQTTSWGQDIKALCKNASFMLSTVGFTCVAFVAGALAWWGPKFVALGMAAQGNTDVSRENDVAFKFGLITMISGILGVPLGAFIAQKLRPKWDKTDPMVCAIGLLLSAPFLFFASICAEYNTPGTFALIFFGELFLNLNWSVVADILLYVVIPTRRSTAEAFQILISHAFGDAGSPYLIGQVSEIVKESYGSVASKRVESATNATSCGGFPSVSSTNPVVDFRSLQYALFICVFVEVLGGLFFVMNGWFIKNDRDQVQRVIAAGTETSSSGSSNDVEAERGRHSSGSRMPPNFGAHDESEDSLITTTGRRDDNT